MPIRAYRGEIVISRYRLQFKKVLTIIFVFLFSVVGIQSSSADPGRRLEINVDALTYANVNPTNLSPEIWARDDLTLYKIYGVRANDTIIFNASNVSDQNNRGAFDIVGYFRDSAGFSITFSKNGQVVLPEERSAGGVPGYYLTGGANLDSYRLEVTLGQDPDVYFSARPNTPSSGIVGFPSDSNGLYYAWELYTSGQWTGSSVAAPAEVSVRKSSNLQFHEAMYGSDKLSDPDGQLRKTVDAIDAKYGYLIK
jgi:hypothetical protein